VKGGDIRGKGENQHIANDNKLSAADFELEKMAKKIRVRAIRKVGEILRQIEAANGANQNIKEGTLPNVLEGRTAAARFLKTGDGAVTPFEAARNGGDRSKF